MSQGPALGSRWWIVFGATLSMMMEPPGLALHLWRPGTGLITHVSYIGTFDGPQPFRTLS